MEENSSNKPKQLVKNLLVITHVTHYYYSDHFYAYIPYQKELETWASNCSQMTIAAPLSLDLPPKDCAVINKKNIVLAKLPDVPEIKTCRILNLIKILPRLVFTITSEMHKNDAIQIRCPGGYGLVSVMISLIYRKPRVVKYASQWTDFPGISFVDRMTKWILRSRFWNSPVLVYGEWPDQPAHIRPFFTSIINEKEMNLARESSKVKSLHYPIRILFVGRLSEQKNVHVLINALFLLDQNNISFTAHVVGEGPMHVFLEQLILSYSLNEKISLVGGKSFDGVLEEYAWADCLVLASETEGWPKAIAEAMAFGVVCIGSDRGLVPQMLSEKRGFTVRPGNAQQLAELLNTISKLNDEYFTYSKNAASWGQRFTLENLEKAFVSTCEYYWKTNDNEEG